MLGPHLSIYHLVGVSAPKHQANSPRKLFVFENSSFIHQRNLAKGSCIIEGTVSSNTQTTTVFGVLRPRFPDDLTGHFVHCCTYIKEEKSVIADTLVELTYKVSIA